jgi:hypothetical protein
MKFTNPIRRQHPEARAPNPLQTHPLTADTLPIVLNYVAEYILQQRTHLTLVTLGGAVNTFTLQSRDGTTDVDFLIPDSKPTDLRLIKEASRYAQSHSPIPLSTHWLNNHVDFLIPREVQEVLIREAMEQDDAIYREPGLMVLVAPWAYIFAAEIERLVLHWEWEGKSGEVARPFDGTDAAVYLHRYFERTETAPALHVSQVRAWSERYKVRGDDDALRYINQEFVKIYGRNGIEFPFSVDEVK